MWAELSLLSDNQCRDLMHGSQDDWDGFDRFDPVTELCAARLSKPRMVELMLVRPPVSFTDIHDR